MDYSNFEPNFISNADGLSSPIPPPSPAQSTSLDMVKNTPARNHFNLDALAMYFLEVFT